MFHGVYMNIVVTGATGYIGTCLAALALKRGYSVVIATRKQPKFSPYHWLFFDLSLTNPITLPARIDAVIHLAANTRNSNEFDSENEIAAARRLMLSAQVIDAKFIFVSSQTARFDAPTAYGRTKWHIEQMVLTSGGWVVRPGQVYGDALRGLFGTLVQTVRQLPFLPMFLPAPQVQPIHVDDLAEGILHLVERRDPLPSLYCLAAPEPVSFAKFLGEIAVSRLRCRRIFLPVPVVFINALGEKLRTKLGLERLRSLFDLPVMTTAHDLEQLGVILRPLSSGLHPSGSDRRRHVLQEGAALLTYVLNVAPSRVLLRRYVRVVEQMRGGQALGLPPLFVKYPVMLSLLDQAAWPDKKTSDTFFWRLDAATVLAEATTMGAARFLGIGSKLAHQHSALGSLISIVGAVAGDILWRLFRLLLSPLVRRTLANTKVAA